VIIIAAFVMAAGIVGRWLTNRFGQPAVLGELLIGMFAGNIGYWAGAPVSLVVMHLTEVAEIFSKVWLSGLSIVEATKQVLREGGLGLGEVGTQLGAALIGPSGPILVVTGNHAFALLQPGRVVLAVPGRARVEPWRDAPAWAAAHPRCDHRGDGAARAGLHGDLVAAARVAPRGPFVRCGSSSATSVGITARVLRDFGKQKTPEALLVLGAR
jgi:hypothetical protein